MPPKALEYDYTMIVEVAPFDGNSVGGIEVAFEAKERVTRISTLPLPLPLEPKQQRGLLASYSMEDDADSVDRFAYLSGGSGVRSLADSFDSIDAVEANSNEAKLIKKITAAAAAKRKLAREGSNTSYASVGSYQPPPKRTWSSNSISEAEDQYLKVLDQHEEETGTEVSHAVLDQGPDTAHPNKLAPPSMEQIMEHFLDAPCCKCTLDGPSTSTGLKSALRSPRWPAVDYYPTGGAAARSSSMSTRSSGRSVQFKDVDIREFKMTLGNHPSATSGPPVMLDWDDATSSSPTVVNLEAYERGRQPRRKRRQLKLSLQQRHQILVKEAGFSFEEVKGAWKDSLQVRKQRKETLERGLALMKWDEVWESTCRKFARVMDSTQ